MGLFIGLIFTDFLCTFYGISAPAYPGQIVALWNFTRRWGWWWLGAACVFALAGIALCLRPEQSKRPARP